MNKAHGPSFTASFASVEIRPGDTWKIYLNACHPHGEMKYLIAEVAQTGKPSCPATRIRIQKESRKNLSGYIYLNTASVPAGDLTFVTLRLRIQIEDSSGRLSREKTFPLAFNDCAEPESPPAGMFEERDLGPVMVQLQPTNLP
jgi:hypothetical protein